MAAPVAIPVTWRTRLVLALLFIAVSALVIVVFSPLRPTLPLPADYLGRIAIIALLTLATVWLHRTPAWQRYWPLAFGLLILAVAVSLDWLFGRYLLDSLRIDITAPAGFTLVKVNEFAVVAVVVILLTRASGGTLGSLYIQRGNLKLGLLIGLGTFLVAAAGAGPMATLIFKARGLTWGRVLEWLPWLLAFVLANAAMEELLFRGLFLRKLEPFYGKLLSNLLIVGVFTLLHLGVTYSASERMFLVVLAPLAIAWGAVMQKTNSIWGSILFHAGMDIPIILGIFSNL